MKLGVYFNIFSGLELLKPALLNVRSFADYIVGVYTKNSNEGKSIPPWSLDLIRTLREEGLLDRTICCKIIPTSIPVDMQLNNEKKYKMGRLACLEEGCTHLMLRDCDEFYEPEQFKAMLPSFEKEELVIAPILEYFVTPLRRSKAISGLHVRVIYKARYRHKRFVQPIQMDMARSVGPVKNYKILSPEELVMHHFTCVRYNETELKRKMDGHGHYVRLYGGDLAQFKESIKRMMEEGGVEEVDDQFGIVRYWEEEFTGVYQNE